MKKTLSLFLAFIIMFSGLQIVNADNLRQSAPVTETHITYDSLIGLRGKPNRIDEENNHKWLTYLTPDYKNYELYYFKDNVLEDIYISKTELLPEYKITSDMKRNDVDKILKDFKPSKITTQYIIGENIYNFYYDVYGLNDIFGLEIRSKTSDTSKIASSNNLSRIYEKQLVDLTNVFRAQNDKKILLPIQKLNTMAKVHSVDMRKNNYLNVIDSKGEGADIRLAEYDLRFKNLGENVANASNNAIGLNKTFIQSEIQRENILSDDYENIGMGICTKGKELYCTQIFLENLKD